MTVVQIDEAEPKLRELAERAANGEEIVLQSHGKTVAKLVGLPGESKAKLPRLGAFEGRFSLPDDFDHGFDRDVAELFGLDNE